MAASMPGESCNSSVELNHVAIGDAMSLRLFESIPDPVLVHHAEGVLFANSACLKMLGAARYDQVVGRPMFDRAHPSDRRHLEARIAEIARSGKAVPRLDTRLVRFDGSSIDIEASITPVGSGSADELLMVFRDVTERKLLEQELRQAQKMEAIGQLTGGVAHDFNNLLTVITGNLEIAAEHAAGVPGLERAVTRAMAAAEIGADLTQRLLSFARRRSLQPQTLDLNKLVGDMRDLLRRSLGEDIEIDIIAAPDLWRVNVDRGQLENSIINLAVNARDAMPEGGKLTIETANIFLDSDYARRNPGVAAGPYVLLEITDTGTGMPADVADRAFEPFFTTKEVDRGSGLGLSMIYGFAQQSGGHVKLFSAEGHGTSVWLCLPKLETADEPVSASPDPIQLPRGQETILVVEDNAAVRDVVVTQLRDLGYQVLSAEDGRAALALLSEARTVDLLFTDLVMPNGINGHQLAEEVQRRRPEIRVLLTSGYPQWSGRPTSQQLSGMALLPKPYKKKDLAVRIRAALDQRAAPLALVDAEAS